MVFCSAKARRAEGRSSSSSFAGTVTQASRLSPVASETITSPKALDMRFSAERLPSPAMFRDPDAFAASVIRRKAGDRNRIVPADLGLVSASDTALMGDVTLVADNSAFERHA